VPTEKFREDVGDIYSSQAPMSRGVIHSWRKYEDSCDGGLGKVGWCVGDGGAPPSLTREKCYPHAHQSSRQWPRKSSVQCIEPGKKCLLLMKLSQQTPHTA
jgi:hypothetical protein